MSGTKRKRDLSSPMPRPRLRPGSSLIVISSDNSNSSLSPSPEPPENSSASLRRVKRPDASKVQPETETINLTCFGSGSSSLSGSVNSTARTAAGRLQEQRKEATCAPPDTEDVIPSQGLSRHANRTPPAFFHNRNGSALRALLDQRLPVSPSHVGGDDETPSQGTIKQASCINHTPTHGSGVSNLPEVVAQRQPASRNPVDRDHSVPPSGRPTQASSSAPVSNRLDPRVPVELVEWVAPKWSYTRSADKRAAVRKRAAGARNILGSSGGDSISQAAPAKAPQAGAKSSKRPAKAPQAGAKSGRRPVDYIRPYEKHTTWKPKTPEEIETVSQVVTISRIERTVRDFREGLIEIMAEGSTYLPESLPELPSFAYLPAQDRDVLNEQAHIDATLSAHRKAVTFLHGKLVDDVDVDMEDIEGFDTSALSFEDRNQAQWAIHSGSAAIAAAIHDRLRETIGRR